MKKLLLIAIALSSLLASIGARASTPVDGDVANSQFCDHYYYRPGPAVADGPASQLDVHRNVFEPEYAKACRIGSGLLTYLGTGEQAGVDAVVNRNSERAFGTGDVALSAQQLAQADLDQSAPDKRGRTNLLHQLPLFITPITIGYNISCKTSTLKLRSQVLSLIFSGVITTWNDRLIVQDNPDLAVCAKSIRLVKRADFAGSTLTFKDYLSKRNPQWDYYKQQAENQLWPTVTNECPALDEDGMVDCLRTTKNSIGYLTFRSAKVGHINVAELDNASSAAQSQFLEPSPQGCTAAAASAVVPPTVQRQNINEAGFSPATPGFDATQGDWSNVSITDAPVGYPMCSIGFAYMYSNIHDVAYFGDYYSANAARTAVDYLWIALSDAAQARLESYQYGMLPANLRSESQYGLAQIRY
ncbi:MAG: substrate-binding domain-containing protein [Actinomycetota bacterium]